MSYIIRKISIILYWSEFKFDFCSLVFNFRCPSATRFSSTQSFQCPDLSKWGPSSPDAAKLRCQLNEVWISTSHHWAAEKSIKAKEKKRKAKEIQFSWWSRFFLNRAFFLFFVKVKARIISATKFPFYCSMFVYRRWGGPVMSIMMKGASNRHSDERERMMHCRGWRAWQPWRKQARCKTHKKAGASDRFRAPPHKWSAR